MRTRKRRKVNGLTRKYVGLLKDHRAMTLFVSLVAFVFVVFISSVVVTGTMKRKAEAAEEQAAQAARAEEMLREQRLAREKESRRSQAFADLDVVGKGLMVYNVNTGKPIFERNADEVFPLASITKVMTIITASDYLDHGSEVYIDEEAINTEGDSGLYLGERWSFKEIADHTMVISSNDGAVAIAKAAGAEIKRRGGGEDKRGDVEVFVEMMNIKAQEIGLRDAIFQNPSGLDLNFETEPSALASPRDVALLFAYALTEKGGLLDNSALSTYAATSIAGRSLVANNTNGGVGSMPGALISKTGNTLQAGGTLAVAVDMGLMQPVVLVSLGSTIADRVSDIDKLYEATKIYFENL